MADSFIIFAWISDMSCRYGLSRFFYFLNRFLSSIEAASKLVRSAVRGLMCRVHEIDLHSGGGRTSQKSEWTAKEMHRLSTILVGKLINKDVIGGCKYYRHLQQFSMENVAVAEGIEYYSTRGYADRLGFKCGACFEYSVFDKVQALRARSLMVLECSMIDACYMALKFDVANKEELKSTCRLAHDSFTVGCHNFISLILIEKKQYAKNI